MKSVQFELVDNVLKAEDFVQLKIAAGFMDRPLRQAEQALRNGLFNVSAIYNGEVIEYQEKGIGKSIVNRFLTS